MQVKAILAFTIKSLISSFFIYYISTTRAILVILLRFDDVIRTMNRLLVAGPFVGLITLDTPFILSTICCQKEKRFVVITFAANYVFRIMEIFLS